MIFRLGMSALDGKNRILDTPRRCPLFLVSAGDRTLEFLGGVEAALRLARRYPGTDNQMREQIEYAEYYA